MITISSDQLTASIALRGAELCSLKTADGLELMWSGDPAGWGWHAPLLFPIVGTLKNNELKLGDLTYTLPRHGFARMAEFECVEQSETKAVFRLNENEETLLNYPFAFELDIIYELIGSTLDIGYRLTNISQEEMPFSIGAHPAFQIPRQPGETYEDYYLEFGGPETLQQLPLAPSGLLDPKPFTYCDDVHTIGLDKAMFQNDAIVLSGFKKPQISLKSNKGGPVITMHFPGFAHFGLWTKPDDTPFLCLEPWIGHADFEDFNGDFREKADVVNLSAGEVFTAKYSLEIS